MICLNCPTGAPPAPLRSRQTPHGCWAGQGCTPAPQEMGFASRGKWQVLFPLVFVSAQVECATLWLLEWTLWCILAIGYTHEKLWNLLLLLPSLHPVQGDTSQARFRLSLERRPRVLLMHMNRWIQGIPAGDLSARRCQGAVQGTGLCAGAALIWADIPTPSLSVCVSCWTCPGGADGLGGGAQLDSKAW